MSEIITPSPGSADGPDEDAIEFAHKLFDAARTGEAPFVYGALDMGAPVDIADANGNTMLMLAAYHRHAGLVRGLVERGAEVDRQNDRGQTPLAGAVFKRYDDVIAVLIEAGADLDAGTPSARATAQMFGISLD